jgi:3-dehydroquinate dehydratase
MSDFLLINGPNLNFSGSHEPVVYAANSLDDVEKRRIEVKNKPGHLLVCYRSNAEHELIDRGPLVIR